VGEKNTHQQKIKTT